MKTKLPRALGALALLFFTFTGQAAISAAVETGGIAVTGATPHHDIVIYGITHEFENFEKTIRTREDLLTADGSGAAMLELESVPSRSLWFAVDVETGDVAAVTPFGFPLREISAPSDLVLQQGMATVLQPPFFYSEILIIRPAVGVWTDSVSRGGSRDLLTSNDRLATSPEGFRNIAGEAESPSLVQAADNVIVIDPYILAFTRQQVPE